MCRQKSIHHFFPRLCVNSELDHRVSLLLPIFWLVVLVSISDLSSNRPSNSVRRLNAGPSLGKSWEIGDLLVHSSFGKGEITHIFGSGEKISIAVKFHGMGAKILDPRLAPIKQIEDI